MEQKKTPKGAILLQEETQKEPTQKPIGAITLVLFDDLLCDVLSETNIDGQIFTPNAIQLSIFRAFLEDTCQKMNISSVLGRYVETKQ